MKNVDTLLSELGHAAREESPPHVDVRQRVLQTIARQRSEPMVDIVPIVFSGVAVATAATLLFAFLPSWQAVFNPWASYFAP